MTITYLETDTPAPSGKVLALLGEDEVDGPGLSTFGKVGGPAGAGTLDVTLAPGAEAAILWIECPLYASAWAGGQYAAELVIEEGDALLQTKRAIWARVDKYGNVLQTFPTFVSFIVPLSAGVKTSQITLSAPSTSYTDRLYVVMIAINSTGVSRTIKVKTGGEVRLPDGFVQDDPPDRGDEVERDFSIRTEVEEVFER